jgi:hypothetical protein
MSSAAYLKYQKAGWQLFMHIVNRNCFKAVGNTYWIQSFSMHITMELYSSVQMVY